MEMFDADYFLNGLNRQFEEEGGDTIVTIVLRSGGTLYVRDVVETHPDYVLFNIWPEEAVRETSLYRLQFGSHLKIGGMDNEH